MKNEPVAIPGAIMAVVVAVLGLAVLFGVPLNREQVGGCITFAGALIGLVTAIQRSKVTPNASVVEYTEGNTVVAGEASDRLAPGDPVRHIGGDRFSSEGGPETVHFQGGEHVRTADETRQALGDLGADGVDDTPRRSAE